MRRRERKGSAGTVGRTAAVLLGAVAAAGAMSLAVLGEPARAALPGSAGAIAFSSSRDGGFHVYRMNSDGFGPTRLTDAPALNIGANWSADGGRVLYMHATGFSAPGEVYSMNADGSGKTNLTGAGSYDGTPSYGPAGGRLAFASDRVEGQYDVYVMSVGADGQTTNLTRLTTSRATDTSPAISPDGRRLLFVSDRDGDEDLYLMKLAPEGPKNVPVKLTRNTPPNPGASPFMHDFDPDWSPDGSQVVFASDRSGNLEVYRMKAAPEGPKNRPVNLSKSPGSLDYDPALSPDGRKVAFTTDRDGNSEVYAMRAADGANLQNLTNHPAADMSPAWQPLP